MRINILYISNEPLKKQRFKWFINYKFFDYTTFQKEDKILEMYQRVFSMCSFYNPHFIILKYRHSNMINEMEKKTLRKFGFLLELKNGKRKIEYNIT